MNKTNQKQIFIHIGSPKTGTTALQSFLVKKRKELREYGIVYPSSGVHSNQHYFLPLLGTQDAKLGVDAWDLLTAELANLGWNTAILSSERFFSADPSKIFDACYSLPGKTHIVLFLRNRKDLIMSCYKTAIRTRLMLACTPDIFLPMFVENTRKFDYDYYIEKWIDSFGRDHVHVLSYEYALAKNNTIETFFDFLSNHDVDLPIFSAEELGLKEHETPPDVVLDLILRTNQFDFGLYPYQNIIQELTNNAEKINLTPNLSTENMQFSDRGNALMEEFNTLWSNDYLSMFSEDVTKFYRRSASEMKAKQLVEETKRVELQRNLLENLPDGMKKQLETSSRKALADIPNVPVIDDELQHYKLLYKRNAALLRVYKDRDLFNEINRRNDPGFKAKEWLKNLLKPGRNKS